MVGVVRHDGFERGERRAPRGEDRGVGGHDGADGDAEGVVLFVVEEGVAVEVDHAIRNTPMAEALADGFGHAHHDHRGEDVGERAGDFEHDHHDGDGDVHDAGQRGGGAQKSVRAGGDAGLVGEAGAEEGGGGEGFVQRLDEDADCAAEGGADGHAGDEDARGHFAAEGDDDEEGAQRGGQEEGEDHVPALVAAGRVSIAVWRWW